MRKILIALFCIPLLAFAKPDALVYNASTNEVVNGELNHTRVSIASITKLMTVYTVIKMNLDLDEKLEVVGDRTPNTVLRKGFILTRRKLIELALVSSDNVAALTLAEHVPGGRGYFIYRMNANAQDLGMMDSNFEEPTGLSPENYSTNSDLIKLTNAASKLPQVINAARLNTSAFVFAETVKKSRDRKLYNYPTSRYFGREGIVAIKTGFTRAAGFCITMIVRSNDQLYNIIVLGARSKQERQRLVESSLSKIYKG